MASHAPNPNAYTGKERLIISLDIGTATSSVSFCHLFPGQVPRISVVTRWPGQETAAGDSTVRFGAVLQLFCFKNLCNFRCRLCCVALLGNHMRSALKFLNVKRTMAAINAYPRSSSSAFLCQYVCFSLTEHCIYQSPPRPDEIGLEATRNISSSEKSLDFRNIRALSQLSTRTHPQVFRRTGSQRTRNLEEAST